jgi:hypothetical protein
MKRTPFEKKCEDDFTKAVQEEWNTHYRELGELVEELEKKKQQLENFTLDKVHLHLFAKGMRILEFKKTGTRVAEQGVFEQLVKEHDVRLDNRLLIDIG